ncbi:MAG: hypothetical protein U9Q81_00645 [Pseudomonadota bacterium]|nr:hypothetical protein [Pseudomonadota bacterium]
MATIDVNELLGDMLGAAQGVFSARWPEVRAFARMESKSFLENMAEIERMKVSGEITREQAELLTRMHKRSMEAVFTSLEGISLALAEQAVNAALAVVRTTVNNAIGWALL